MLRALAFAGSDQVVTCGDAPTGGRAALTFECWVHCDVIGEGNRPILSKWSADGGQEWALYVSRDGRLYCVVNDVAEAVAVGYSAPGVLPAGEWRHVAACFDAIGEAVRVLVHGADVTELGEAFGNVTADTAAPVRLGGWLADDALGFSGCIGWVRLSSSVRYPGSSYVVPWLPPGVDGATLAQWAMSEGSGNTLDNCQGNAAYDGVITGATWMWGPKVGRRPITARPRPAVLQAAVRAWRLRARDRRGM